MGRLVRGRMLARLGQFFPARVTLQKALATRDGVGQAHLAWSDVQSLADVRGQLAPASEEKLRLLGLTVERTTHVLGLDGCYAGITPAMRAVVDGVAYEVTGVRTDSLGIRTYVGLKLVVASDLSP